MATLHILDYNPKQIILFPQRLDKDIAENDPVRIVDSIVDHLKLETLGKLNSYSKTDRGATFMRMKEDAMLNGQTKPGYLS